MVEEKKETDIAVVLTQSQSGDEVTLFMKSLNGQRVSVDDVLRIMAAIDVEGAMGQMKEAKVHTHPMPKDVM